MSRPTCIIAIAVIVCCLMPSVLSFPTATAVAAAPAWEKTSLPAQHTYTLLVDPTDTSTVLAGTAAGLFRTTDAGSTWKPYGTGLNTASSSILSVYSLGSDRDGIRFYAGTSAGAFQSQDRGATWSQGSGMLAGGGILRYYYAVSSLSVATDDPLTAYAGDSGMMTQGRVLKTTDGGATWRQASSGIDARKVRALALSPADSATVYAVVDDMLYVTRNAADSWTVAEGHMEIDAKSVDAITVVATADTVVAGTTGGVWTSHDNGATWSQGMGLHTTGMLQTWYAVGALAVSPATPSTLYAGDSGMLTSGGVFVSTNGGTSWSQAGTGLTDDINALAVAPSNPVVVYAATDTGIYRLVVPSATTPDIEPPPSSHTIVLTIGSSVMTVDGTSVSLDAPPVIRESRTLLPIRAVIEALEGSVSWDAAQRKVTVTLGDHTVALWIASRQALVDGVPVELDVPALIMSSRTFVPLRFVTENLGCTVTWDPVTRTVTIRL